MELPVQSHDAGHEGRPHTLIFHSLEAFRRSKSRDCRAHQIESQNLTRKEAEDKRKSCLQYAVVKLSEAILPHRLKENLGAGRKKKSVL